MKVILVPVADRPECAKALRTAFVLARRLDANVIGCHMRPHRHSQVSLSGYFVEELLGDSSKALDLAWQKKSGARSSAAARALYSSVAETCGYALSRKYQKTPVALWQEKVGSPDKLMQIFGPLADLLVVSRPKADGGKVAGLFMLAALMESARPVLILPQNGRTTVGDRICIAWNQSAEAARTVAAAMPIVQRASHVTIATCGPENRVGPKAGQLAAYLDAWGVDSDHVTSRGLDADKELIAAYRRSKSDLLLMGAYSRSRWRETVFGGTSNYMLNRANIPVLMLHT